MRQLAILFTIALAACAAQEPPAVVDDGTVTISGADAAEAGLWLIDLGTASVGEHAERTITLHNGMASPTWLTPGPLEPPFEIDLQRRELAPGESLEVPIRFAPLATGQRETVTSIAHEGGSIDLRLRAAGSALGTECLEVTPPALVFDATPIDCPAAHGSVAIRNTCKSAAAVELRLSSARRSFGWSRMTPTPALLRAGEVLEAEVAFLPVAVGVQQGELLVGGGDGRHLKVALSGEGSAAARVSRTTVFGPTPRWQYDLLIVVDGSEAMEPWRDQLVELVTSIEWWVIDNWFDVRVGVTTSSFTEREGCGGEGGHLLPIGDPEVLTHETVDFAARLQGLLDAGTCVPAGEGRPLEAALHAADRFSRPSAHLAILLIGAEDDQGEEPVAAYVTRLHAASARKAVTVAAVHPSTSCGGTDDGSRLVGFADAFAGWTSTICSDEWWEHYFGYIFDGSRRVYFLDELPVDVDGDGQVTSSEVHVEVNDEPLPRTWEDHSVWGYDASGNRIQFNPFFQPSLDATVTVHYEVAAPPDCPRP